MATSMIYCYRYIFTIIILSPGGDCRPMTTSCQPHFVRPGCQSRGELANRSYRFPAHWPFAAFDLVMELQDPGSCDLYAHRWRCCKFTSRAHIEPERHVREAIASFLFHDCPFRSAERPCRAVDLGANNGWFSAMMIMAGAMVTAVEPQPDLARALMETMELNCWQRRGRILNTRACAESEDGYTTCMAVSDVPNCALGGWRSGGGVSRLTRQYGSKCAKALGLPDKVGGIDLSSLLLGSATGATPTDAVLGAGPASSAIGANSLAHAATVGSTDSGALVPAPAVPTLDLLKMDADGPEGGWLRQIDRLISARRLRVRSLIIEGSDLSPSLMQVRTCRP